jgi:hypothetical protein
MTPVDPHEAVHIVPVGVFGTSFTISNILQTLMALFSGGTLLAIAKIALDWRQAKDNSALALKKLDAEEDSSLRRDLLARISVLETQLTTSDARCDARMFEMRRDYEARIDALTRQMIASQVSSGRAMGFTPEAIAAADRVIEKIAEKGSE